MSDVAIAKRMQRIEDNMTKQYRLYIGSGANVTIINYTVARRRFMKLMRLWRFAAYPAMVAAMLKWFDKLMAMPSDTVQQLGDFMAALTVYGLVLLAIIVGVVFDLRYLIGSMQYENTVKRGLKK